MSPFPTSATTWSTSTFRVSNVEYGINVPNGGIGVPSIRSLATRLSEANQSDDTVEPDLISMAAVPMPVS